MNRIQRNFLILFFGTCLFCSCSIEKRHYTSGYYFQWNHAKSISSPETLSQTFFTNDFHSINSHPIIETESLLSDNVDVLSCNPVLASLENHPIVAAHQSKLLLDSLKNCDILILNSGEEIYARIVQITKDEIYYKKCDSLDVPPYSVLQNNTFMIKYADGTKRLFHYRQMKQGVMDSTSKALHKNKVEGLGLTGFISGIVGLIIAGFIFGTMALIFGFSSLGKIKRYPERFYRDGFAISSIILGVVDIIGAIIFLILVL